jgi:hypothetical protein
LAIEDSSTVCNSVRLPALNGSLAEVSSGRISGQHCPMASRYTHNEASVMGLSIRTGSAAVRRLSSKTTAVVNGRSRTIDTPART